MCLVSTPSSPTPAAATATTATTGLAGPRLVLVAVGSRGDVQPYVALGVGLAAAGYDVHLATHQPFRTLVTTSGLGFRLLGVDPHALITQQLGRDWLASSDNPYRFFRGLARLARAHGQALADDIAAACEDADAVLFSAFGFAAVHAAEARGIPAVAALLTPASPTREFPTVLLPAAPDLGGRGNRWSAAAAAALFDLPFRGPTNAWRRDRLGLPPVRGRSIFAQRERSREPVLYGYSPLVAPRPADWLPHLQVTGYWQLPHPPGWQPPPSLAAFLAAGPKPVYLGFGSMAPRDPEALARTLLAAVRRSGRRAVVGAGWAGLALPAGPDLLPIGDVPHDWLFPRCAAVVHHGGAGTTGTALTAGVPALAVPFFADQFFWGRRIAALGAGPPPLPARRLRADALAAAIRQLTEDPAMRTAAAGLGRRLRAEDGVGAAVAAVRRLVPANGR